MTTRRVLRFVACALALFLTGCGILVPHMSPDAATRCLARLLTSDRPCAVQALEPSATPDTNSSSPSPQR